MGLAKEIYPELTLMMQSLHHIFYHLDEQFLLILRGCDLNATDVEIAVAYKHWSEPRNQMWIALSSITGPRVCHLGYIC